MKLKGSIEIGYFTEYNTNVEYFYYVCMHSCNLSQAPQAPLVYFFPAGVLFSTENAKGTILNMPCHALPINKYAKQNQQVHQSKQQICHISIFIQ